MSRRLSSVVLAALIAGAVPVSAAPAFADGPTVELRDDGVRAGEDLVIDLSGCPEGDLAVHLFVGLEGFGMAHDVVDAGQQPWEIQASVPSTVPIGGGDVPLNPGIYRLEVDCGAGEEIAAGTAWIEILVPLVVPSGAGVEQVTAAPSTAPAGGTIELPLPGGDHFGSDRVPLLYLYDEDGPRRLEPIGPAPGDGPTYPVEVELPAQIAGSQVSLVAFGETWNQVPASPIAVASITIGSEAPTPPEQPKPTEPEKTDRDHLDDIMALLKDGKPIVELPKVKGKAFGSLKEVLTALGVKIAKADGKKLKEGLDAKQQKKLADELAKKTKQQKDVTEAAKQKRATAARKLLKEQETQKKLEEELAKQQQLLAQLEREKRAKQAQQDLQEELRRQQLEEQQRRLVEQSKQAEELKRQLAEQKRAKEEAQRNRAQEQAKIALELKKKLEEQKKQSSKSPGTAAPPLYASEDGPSVGDHIVGIATPLGIELGPWGLLTTLPSTNGPLDTVVPDDLDLEGQVLQILTSQGLLFPKLTTPIALPGFEPQQTVMLAVESTLTPLAEGVAGADGVVRMDVVLPESIDAGSHTLYAVAGDQATIADVQVAGVDDVVDAVLSIVDVLAVPADGDAERVAAEPELPETGRSVLLLFTFALAALLAGALLLRRRATVLDARRRRVSTCR